MKPNLAFINGWAHCQEDVVPLVEALADFFEVRVFSADEFATDDREPLLPEAQSPWILGGWSLGAMFALELAAACPERVSSVVFCNSTAKFCSESDWPLGVPVANMRAMLLGLKRRPSATLVEFYRQVSSPFDTAQTSLDERVQRAMVHSSLLEDGLRYLMKSDFRSVAERVEQPALVMHGRHDRVVPCQAGKDLAERLPRSTWSVHDEVGHDLPIRDPDWVTAELTRFWNDHVAP